MFDRNEVIQALQEAFWEAIDTNPSRCGVDGWLPDDLFIQMADAVLGMARPLAHRHVARLAKDIEQALREGDYAFGVPEYRDQADTVVDVVLTFFGLEGAAED